jgi:hypothetical protein
LPVLRGAEVEDEQLHRLFVEDRRHRLVVTVVGFPLLDGLRRNALRAELHARHVVGRIDDEEQQERNEVDPDQDRDGVERAPDDVGEHQAGRAAILSRFR